MYIYIYKYIYKYVCIYLFTITYLYWFVEMRSPHWGPCFSTCTGGLEGSFHAERVGKGGKGCLVWAHWSPEMPRICPLKQGPWGLLPFCSVKKWGFESLWSFSNKLLEVTRFFDKAFFWPLSKLPLKLTVVTVGSFLQSEHAMSNALASATRGRWQH